MIIKHDSNENDVRAEAGNKGYALYVLTNKQISVPSWVIIGKGVFDQFQEYSEIHHIIDTILTSLQTEALTSESISTAYETIHAKILEAPLPDDLVKEIENGYKTLNVSSIAIRSSIFSDNPSKMSFAGQHATFLSVNGLENVVKALKECWISAFSPSALAYRIAHKQPLCASTFKMAVIFQKMISSEKSGFFTTSDIYNADNSIITINATYGCNTGITTGKVDTDTYKVCKATNRITLLSIVNKRSQFLIKDDTSCPEESALSAQLRTSSCLSYQQIADLAQTAKSIEAFFGTPQIVEWTWTESSGFVILQASPTEVSTTHFSYHKSQTVSMDKNKNLTYPLTFGFTRHFCHNSFLQLCKSMHLSKKDIQSIVPSIEHIMGSIFGRTYYNILNIYHLSALILPGSGKRKVHSSIAKEYQKRHYKFENNDFKCRGNSFRRLLSLLTCIWYHFNQRSYIKKFTDHFNTTCAEYTKFDFSKMSSVDIYKQYLILEKNVFSNWKVPSINNYLSMEYFKFFRLLTKRWFADSDSSLEKAFLLVNNSETSDSFKELSRVTDMIRQNDSIQKHSVFSEINKSTDSLIKYYTTMSSTTSQSLKNKQPEFYGPTTSNSTFATVTPNGSSTHLMSKTLFEKQLERIKLFLYKKSLLWTRNTVNNRVISARFKTRICGIVNSMFKGIGEDLAKNGIIDSAEDIFYLDFEMLKTVIDGTLPSKDLRKLIAFKKEQYKSYGHMDPPLRIITDGPIYWLNNSKDNSNTASSVNRSKKIKGTRINGGFAEGKVVVADSKTNLSSMRNKIALSSGNNQHLLKHIPFTSGLVLENNSIFSHCVIIAREFGIPVLSCVKDVHSLLQTGITVRLDSINEYLEFIPETKTTSPENEPHVPSEHVIH